MASSTDNTPAGQSPREILKKLNETKPFYVVGSGKLLITYTWLPSLKGDSAILVQANIPRTIKRKGTQTIRILLASAFAVGLMVILILLIYLQRTIARPIAQLTDHTVNIRATDDLTLRCGSNRKDEIGILSREIDHMVHRIQELYSGMDAEIKYKTAELNQTGQRLTLETKERKETAESLRKSREFLRELFENAPFGIVRLNEDNLIVDVNKSFERIFLFSLDECQGKAIDQLIVPDGMETEAVSVSDRTFQGESSYLETVRKSKGGDLVDVRIHGIPIVLDGANIGIYGIYIDVTEEKRIQREREHLEAQLLDAKKMEAVGTLAGGMAHEFNNLMAVMMGNIDMLLGFGTEDDTQNRRLMGIKKSADKAARLTEQLLAFSRHQLLKLETLDLNDLIKSISYMVCSRYGENVELELRQSPNACYVKGDQNLLIQVLMDIVQNAAEAMTEGGQLTLTVEHAPKENNNKRQLKDEPVEDCACIIITDTGMGMEPETVEHIFEPFFTTKPVGQATGLGLAFVYGTIKQHNGRLEVTSKPGIGTTFRLYLPEIEAAT
ncbi:MAG: PAS domain S-box protein [bacterium]|nr:PAS domain S-box protein [bacterium]